MVLRGEVTIPRGDGRTLELIVEGFTFPTSLTFAETSPAYVAEAGLPFDDSLPPAESSDFSKTDGALCVVDWEEIKGALEARSIRTEKAVRCPVAHPAQRSIPRGTSPKPVVIPVHSLKAGAVAAGG